MKTEHEFDEAMSALKDPASTDDEQGTIEKPEEVENAEKQTETGDNTKDAGAVDNDSASTADGKVSDDKGDAKKDAGEDKQGTAPDTIKLKINGREVDVTHSDVIKLAQKAAASDERFREAAQREERIVAYIDDLKKRPFEALDALGIDKNQLREQAERYLADIYKQEEMTPEQKAAEENARKVAILEKERDELRKASEAQMQAHYEQAYQQAIIQALEKSALPKTEDSVIAVARHMYGMVEAGENPDEILKAVDKIVEKVEQEYSATLKTLLGDEERKKKLLGETASETKKPENRAAEKTEQPMTKREKRARTLRDFDAVMDRRFGK